MAHTIIRKRNMPGQSIKLVARRRDVDGGYEADDSYTGEEILTCQVYAGQNTPVLTTLPAQWLDFATATIGIDFPALELQPGVYLALVLADGTPIAEFQIELEDSPGEQEFRPTYLTSSDLQSEFWQIEQKLGKTKTDGTGYAEYMAQAREWLDTHILQSYRPGGCRNDPASFYVPFWDYSDVGPKWLADHLAQNHLLLTTPGGRQLRLAMVYFCLSKILLRSAISGNIKDQLSLAEEYSRMAENLIICTPAEIDTNGDGLADVRINMGVTVTRRY